MADSMLNDQYVISPLVTNVKKEGREAMDVKLEMND